MLNAWLLSRNRSATDPAATCAAATRAATQQATMSVVLRSLFGFLWGSSLVNIQAITVYIRIFSLSYLIFCTFYFGQGMLRYADSLPLLLCPAQIPMTCCPPASHLGMRGLGYKKRIVTEWAWTWLFFFFLKVYPWPKLTYRGQTYSLGRNDTTRAATEDKHSLLQMTIMSQERIPESESWLMSDALINT